MEKFSESPRESVKYIQDQFDSAFNELREKDLVIQKKDHQIAGLHKLLDESLEKMNFYMDMNEEGCRLRRVMLEELKKSQKVNDELSLIAFLCLVVGSISFVGNLFLPLFQ